MKVLDTDHLTALEQDSAEGRRLRTRLGGGDEQVATTIVTVEEHLRGWLALINRFSDPGLQIAVYARLQRQVELFGRWRVLPFDQDAVSLFLGFQKQRIRIGSMDLKIASIAMAHDATLLTRNSVDFGKVPGLRFESWLD